MDDKARIEAFFAEATQWPEEMRALRKILLSCGVGEEYKWRQPCYTHNGGNLGMVYGFKDNCTLSFFKGVLLKDPEGILEPPGENSRSARVIRFHGLEEIEHKRDVLVAYIREAMANEEAGLKVEFPKDDLDYPEELVTALEADEALNAAFHALTPGRQRGWVLNFSQPKQSKTRISRIEKARARILQGKGMHDR